MSSVVPLQGYELVAHVFVAADVSSDGADYRFVVELWHRCVAAFGLTETVAFAPAEPPGEVSSTVDDEQLLAARESLVGGLHQVVLRQVHDVLCLSLVCALSAASGWAELDAQWRALQAPPTPGVLGAVRILQARLADAAAGLDVAALTPAVVERSGVPASWWRSGVLRPEPPLGPFTVWEAVDDAAGQRSRDGRADRCVAVVAPHERDAQLSAWTWSRGDRALTPFARYLMHAAKLRYELRVRAASPAGALRRRIDEAVVRLEPVVEAGGAVEAVAAESARADLAGLLASGRRVADRARRLAELRITAQIAAQNMAAHAGHDQAEGLFADDRDVAAWLDQQIDRDLAYLEGPAEAARQTAGALPNGITVRTPRPVERGATRVAELSGMQRKLLIEALAKAYPNYRRLAMMFGTEMDRSLADYAAEGPMPTVLFDVIIQAEAEGWVASWSPRPRSATRATNACTG